jgi:hypothetical protein
MQIRRLSLLGLAAACFLGACSSSGATTPTTAVMAEATTTTSAAPTTAAPATAAPITPGSATAAATEATAALVSNALVAQSGGKLSATDATCLASGLFAKYDLSQLTTMQSGAASPEAAAATAAVIVGCVGADRAAELGAMLAPAG